MIKKSIIIVLCLFMLLGVSTLVMANRQAKEPVQTQTQFSQSTNCEDCDGEPLQRQFQARVQRELAAGEMGETRRAQRQRFGQ